jgi:hypothetical protein
MEPSMNQRNTTLTAACLLAIGMVGTLPAPAQAQATSDNWRFEATVYGWFPAISADMTFAIPGGNSIGTNQDMSASDVLDALKFAFFASFEAKKGKYGLWTDIVYADLGGTKVGVRNFDGGRLPVPVDLNSNLSVDMKSLVWTVAGTYSLAASPEYTVDVLGGARLLDMTNTLDFAFSAGPEGNPLRGRSGSSEISVNFWDAVVGLKGRANFGADRKWFIPYYVDVGTGQSKLTWQLNAGVGYRYSWGSVIGTWRYLDYSFDSDRAIESMSFNGPTIGVAFQF